MKNQRIKKILACVLAGGMVLSTAACGGKEANEKVSNKKETSGNAKFEDASIYNEPGTFPILKEKQKLTIGMKQSAFVTDYNTNKFTQWLEEKMNIDLEFVLFPEQDADQKLSVMINAGDELPDIININLNTTDAEKYGNLGAFIPLNEYYEKSSYYIKDLMENPDFADLMKYYTASDGNIYTVPKITLENGNIFSRKAWINKNWLDKYNLEVPETADELYTALKTFVEEDANGNGKKDEIPFVGNTTGWSQSVAPYLMSAFVYTNPDTDYLIVKDGKIDVAYRQEEWKKGLEWMNILCKEGLLSTLSFTQDQQQFKALVEGPEEQTIGGFTAARPQYPVEDMRKTDFVALPPLKGPDGVQNSIVTGNGLPVSQFHITRNCKNPEVAFKLADLMMSEEASMFQRHGEPEVDWKEVDGKPVKGDSKYKMEAVLQFGEQQNSHWQTENPGFIGDFLWTETWDGTLDPEKSNYYGILIAQSTELYKQYEPKEHADKIVYSAEEMEELMDIKASLRSYVDEQMVAFATGSASLETWDAYLEELNVIGIERYLELTQEAYDRMIGK